MSPVWKPPAWVAPKNEVVKEKAVVSTNPVVVKKKRKSSSVERNIKSAISIKNKLQSGNVQDAINEMEYNKKPDKEIISKTDFYQDLYEQEGKLQTVSDQYYTASQEFKRASFDPVKNYTFTENNRSVSVPGFQAQAFAQNLSTRYEKESMDILDTKTSLFRQREKVTDWHSDTKVTRTKTDDGGFKYDVDFPFAGAEVYHSTRKNIEDQGALGKVGLALTPSNFAGIPGTIEYLSGNTAKAHQIEVESVANTKNDNFLSFYLSSPPGVIGMFAISAGGSAVAAPVVGKIATAAPKAFAIGSKAFGIGTKALVGYGVVKSVYDKGLVEGEWGRVGGDVARLGLNYAAFTQGSKYGMGRIAGPKSKYPDFRSGADSGRIWKINHEFDKNAAEVLKNLKAGKPTDHLMTSWKAGAHIPTIKMDTAVFRNAYFNQPKVTQPEPTFNNIRNLMNKTSVKNFFKSHTVFRNQKMIGGVASNKPSTGDFDTQYYSSYGKAEASFITKKLGAKSLKDVSDPHYIQRPGTMVTTQGGVSMKSYYYPSGREGIKWLEQWNRLSDSAINPAHIGRVKDAPESVRMLKQIYPKGLPKKLGFTTSDYAFNMKGVELYPNIMSSSASKIVYGASLGDKVRDVSAKFFEKSMGWKYSRNMSRMNISSKPLQTATVSYSYTPPSIGYNPSSILSPLQMSAALNPSKYFGTTSKSFTYSKPSISSSLSKSFSMSKTFNPFSSSSKSFSRSFSSSSGFKSPSISSSLSSSIGSFSSPSYKSSSSISKSFSSGSSSSKMSSSFSSSSSSSSIIGGGYGFPVIGLKSRGSDSGYNELFNPRYRYREFKVPSLKKLFGGIKI